MIIPMVGFIDRSYAQYYVTGQSPASIQWQQVHTENFQIIFSKEVNDEANQLANMLEYAYQYIQKTLDHEPGKISVLLHNHTVQSNGLVAWAPKRMEAFLIPPQNSYAQQWLDQLAVHELRHVVQIDKLKQGMSKVLYVLFGEQIIGAIAGYLPDWFYEGDAVCTETGLTFTGRGRLAAFEKEIKAVELDKHKYYSYDKIVLGSYRNHVPNHYQYGYFITAYGRKKYGALLWDSVVNFVARNPYSLFASYFGIKKYTGLSKRKLYLSAMDYMENTWKFQVEQLSPTSFKRWNKRENTDYTNYRHPQYINDSTIIVEKSGIDQIAKFIILTQSGEEKKIHTPGFYSSLNLSYQNGQLIWGEYIPDTRWGKRDYYVVKSYDFEQNKTSMITSRSRYFAPCLSNDATKIVVVEHTIENKCYLSFLHPKTGNKIKSIPTPGYDIQFPSWNLENNAIYATAVTSEGKMIIKYHIDSNVWDTIRFPAYHNISRPVSYREHLFFSSDYSGIDNIYALHLPTGSLYQLTSSVYGAYNPTINSSGDKLLYSDYTSKGYNIVEVHVDDLLWQPIEHVRQSYDTLAQTISNQESNKLLGEHIPDSNYHIKPYKKYKHLFNVHSWMPFFVEFDQFRNLNNPNISPGITLLSQNLLGSAITIVGYGYENNRHRVYNKFIYRGWYPAFEISTNYGNKPSIFSGFFSEDEVGYDRFSINSRIYLPLNLTRNRYIRGIQPSVKHQYANDYYFDFSEREHKRGIQSFNHQLFLYNYLKTSTRDISPRFGQTASLGYAHSAFNKDLEYAAFIANLRLYIPGLFNHHSIKTEYGYQQNYKESFYSNALTLPYGFRETDLYSKSIQTFHVRYMLPLFYPDLSFSSILYIKRFKAALFFGIADIKGNRVLANKTIDIRMRSMGYEITSDVFVFRLRAPLIIGARFIYFPEMQNNTVEMVLNFGISSF